MQRSAPSPLLTPCETLSQYRLRKRRVAWLDWLLWRVEEHNWWGEPELPAPWALVRDALRAGCSLRWPCTGAMLHAAVLHRQGHFLRPVYIRTSVGHLREEDGGIPFVLPAASVRLHEIDERVREVA